MQRALANPVPDPQCGCGTVPAPAPAPAPEVYNENNGKPLVLYAYGDSANDVAPPCGGSLPAPPAPAPVPLPCLLPPAPAPLPCPLPTPPPVPCPAPAPPPTPCNTSPVGPSDDTSDLTIGQQLADQSIAESPVETIPAPDQPCKVETSTEVIHTPGETFVHQPGEILINQPPTRLIINHAPYIVRPSPIVLNSGSKKITNAYTRKTLPSTIQLRPVIVRIVRPIEKKVLIDKPAGPAGGQTYVGNPVIPDACSSATGSSAIAIPAQPATDSGYGVPALDYTLPLGGIELQPSAGDASALGGLDLSSLLASQVRII